MLGARRCSTSLQVQHPSTSGSSLEEIPWLGKSPNNFRMMAVVLQKRHPALPSPSPRPPSPSHPVWKNAYKRQRYWKADLLYILPGWRILAYATVISFQFQSIIELKPKPLVSSDILCQGLPFLTFSEEFNSSLNVCSLAFSELSRCFLGTSLRQSGLNGRRCWNSMLRGSLLLSLVLQAFIWFLGFPGNLRTH